MGVVFKALLIDKFIALTEITKDFTVLGVFTQIDCKCGGGKEAHNTSSAQGALERRIYHASLVFLELICSEKKI
jgi:hypothetical protein